ncbi:hypothetical protein PsorP6_016857 [Peronosclerospora sorghi]|uniref:Uncharacterized protein n=1 Tax=Peronosclerospora sorghi TaxID=230839 RepID=A0ACC0WGA8_9STRA|nr:hypothetical protein PsorP6_016857 [Peronosclerospora sorghi]
MASSLVRLAFLEDFERQSSCAQKTRRSKLALALIQLESLRSNIRERSFLAASCIKLHLLPVTRGVFNYVLGYFQDDFVVRSGPGKVGPPARVPHKHVALAIVLMYYAGTMAFKVLQKLFGVHPATLSRTFTKRKRHWQSHLHEFPRRSFDGLHLKPSPSGAAWSSGRGSYWKTGSASSMVKTSDAGIIASRPAECLLQCRGFQAKLLHERFRLSEMGEIANSSFSVSKEMFKKIITLLKQGDIDTIPR